MNEIQRVALVTGGGRSTVAHGVGSATAVMLADRGFQVVVVDIDQAAAARTADEVVASGGAAVPLVADLSSLTGCETAFAGAMAVAGRIDALVNNVAVVQPGNALAITDDQWTRTLDLNLTSAFRMSKLVVQVMTEQQSGSIVNMSSIAGLRGGGDTVAYATSKAGLIGLTLDMAASHGADGIRVNAIAPGYLYTPMVAAFASSAEKRRARARLGALETEGTCWDVAEAVAFLVSDASRWITATVLPVDAGVQALQPLNIANKFGVMG